MLDLDHLTRLSLLSSFSSFYDIFSSCSLTYIFMTWYFFLYIYFITLFLWEWEIHLFRSRIGSRTWKKRGSRNDMVQGNIQTQLHFFLLFESERTWEERERERKGSGRRKKSRKNREKSYLSNITECLLPGFLLHLLSFSLLSLTKKKVLEIERNFFSTFQKRFVSFPFQDISSSWNLSHFLSRVEKVSVIPNSFHNSRFFP